MLILAAVITPGVVASLDRARIDAAVQELTAIRDAVVAFESDVGEFPFDIRQLDRPIVAGDTDSCGSPYNNGERNRWDGPYLDRVIPDTGYPVAIGQVVTNLFRSPALGNPAYLVVVVLYVNQSDAEAVNLEVDADANPSGGTVWYTQPADAEGLVSLYWLIPINSC